MEIKNKLYYTISEVAEILEENQSTIRFWEKSYPKFFKFKRKNNNQQKRYTVADIQILQRIKELVRISGLGIKEAEHQLIDFIPNQSFETMLETKKGLIVDMQISENNSFSEALVLISKIRLSLKKLRTE
ncbi:MAG: MerR family transcriptional regulator [Candidatus Delongbacteria bacterium]|nr:MerR family transcriptional regulator [Candidatus Delongbacteria bacterium]MBN2833401.1 MerR family transcriptional regulator [Candidatus Delongbacteria bacterium]